MEDKRYITPIIAVLGTSGAWGLIVGLTISGSGADKRDISPYLNLLCEGSSVTRDVSTLDLDLKEGQVIKIGDHELESVGYGLILFEKAVVQGSIAIEDGGFNYDVRAENGEGGGTEIIVSRSCERR